jgi:leucyl aminopeptidase
MVSGVVLIWADLPKLAHQRWVKPCFDDISTQEMHDNLAHLTSYYNRYYYSINGEKSARWIHDYLSKVSHRLLVFSVTNACMTDLHYCRSSPSRLFRRTSP